MSIELKRLLKTIETRRRQMTEHNSQTLRDKAAADYHELAIDVMTRFETIPPDYDPDLKATRKTYWYMKDGVPTEIKNQESARTKHEELLKEFLNG